MANSRQEEKTAQTTEAAAESTRRAGEQAAEQASRLGRAAADAGEHVAQVGADVFRHNTEAVQNAWRSTMELATMATQRSADQFVRAFGLSGNESQEATQQAARNVEAMAQSSGALAEGMSGITREWFDFVRDRMDKNLERLDELWHCRTPQDVVAVQSELLRENVEGVLQTSRRVADASVKLADNASRKMTETVDRTRRAA
jgi:hypothetical protein